MAKSGGIINERNSFAKPSWVKQGYGLTSNKGDRRAKLGLLFGKTVEQIKAGDGNECRWERSVFRDTTLERLRMRSHAGAWERSNTCVVGLTQNISR